jgi:hypothetical protein
MPTIKSTRLSETTDGKKRLAKVLFTPQVPNPACQFDVEVTFEVRRLDAAHLDGDPYAVILLSCTRVDTREPYTLSDEQKDAVIDSACVAAAEADGLGFA